MDIDKLSKEGLVAELSKRGEDTRGTKAVLRERLQEVLREEEFQTKPVDEKTAEFQSDPRKEETRAMDKDVEGSVKDGGGMSSPASSKPTSVRTSASLRSERVMEQAKQAGLLAKRDALRKKHEIEAREAELRRLKEELEVDMEIEESKARQKVLLDFEESTVGGPFRNVAKTEMNIEENKTEMKMEKGKSAMKTEENEAKATETAVGHEDVAAQGLMRIRQRSTDRGEPPGQPATELEPEPSPRPIHNPGQLHDYAGLLRLPVVEVKKFGGEVTEFAHFLRSFDLKIGSKVHDAQEKLYYLEQHMVQGSKPHHIVASCLYLENGYEEARRLLQKRYGQHGTLAASFLDKIQEQKQIRSDDSEALDRFAILLASCKNALEGSHLMDDPRTLRSITMKLPQHLIYRWRQKADDIQETQQRRTRFEDLVGFISKEARVASNAEFGQQMYEGQLTSRTGRSISDQRTSRQVTGVGPARSRVSMATGNVSVKQNLCLFCQQSHETDQCPKLEAKTQEEKTSFVKSNGLCFSCMRKGHVAASCHQRSTCTKCGRRHPTVLHRPPRSPPDTQTAATSGHAASRRENGGKLQVVPVTVLLNGRRVKTGAFLDTGSTHSFITHQLVSETGMAPASHQMSMTVSTIASEKKVCTSMVPGVVIENEETGAQQELPPLYTLDSIPVTQSDIPSADDLSKWPYLLESGVTVPDQASVPVGLLIGSNAAAVMEPLRVVRSEDGGPYATLTRYGWILSGIDREDGRCRVNRIKISQQPEEFENFADVKRGLSREDVRWCLQVESTCKFGSDGKYEIGLPLRSETGALPNNYVMAKQRLDTLKRRFLKNPSYAADYKSQIEKLLIDGHAEKVPEDAKHGDGRKWYLPHHSVVSASKPDKLRVVFDCAARYNDVCLNDLLLQGPDLTNSLSDVLLRFRQEPVGLMADVEAMFLQVRVPENHRDYLRFLWWPEGDVESQAQEYRMTVHLFGATSSPSCANYALHRTAEDFGDFDAEAAQTLRQNFYVDDLVKATRTEEEATRLAMNLKKLCAQGGFNLRKFASNRVPVLQALDQDRAKLDERALGVLWDLETDELGFHVDLEAMRNRPATRRGLLSATAACYDPLGLVAPFVLRGRMMTQELTRLKYGWDDKIPRELEREWTRWMGELSDVMQFRVPRCVSPAGLSAAGVIELHHFADASQEGYGTASYVRTVSADGEIHCSLLTSRAHLAPIKSVSIPRLELTAAKLAVQVNMELRRTLEVSPTNVWFWTDSTAVLKYICNETTRYHVFVANRLAVIHDGSSTEQWKFVPSKQNPADCVSRGMSGKDLLNSDLWTKGPAFLWMSEDKWPERPDLEPTTGDDPEVKSLAIRAVETKEADEEPVDRLIAHYSSWTRLKRGVSWIRKTIEVLKRKTQKKSEGVEVETELTLKDLEEAEKCIIKRIQKRRFPDEFKDLEAGRPVKLSSPLARLDPVLQDGILRASGRLKHSSLSSAAKYPVILPKKGRTVDLLIQDYHRRAGHEGRQHVLADIRGSYWILGANSAVRRVLSRCLSCRRRQKPPESQRMADLPEDRVQDGEKPFTRTGVDFFGPFYAKRGRSSVKKYGVIFTCLAVRAVHIEVAESLSTDSFLCALRRFVARRGEVRVLRSDRGTNFTGADSELRSEVDRLHSEGNKIHRAALAMQIDWKFNPPHASHFGGVWERQIRTIRKIMNALLTEQTFSEETLQTLLCEVECIMNNRPLTPVSADLRDGAPITPNHILHLESVTLPGGDSPRCGDLVGRSQWRRAAYLAECFWRRWRQEYLPLLQERTGPTTRSKANLKSGDVVLMVDNTVPRGVWPLGRVEEVFLGADGRVRTVRVRCRGTNYIRPITKLVKILPARGPDEE